MKRQIARATAATAIGVAAVAANTRRYGVVGGLNGYYQLELRGCLVSATGVLDNDR